MDCLGWATGNACGECHICVLVRVFREVRRVLRRDGTLVVNYGDAYNSSLSGGKGITEGFRSAAYQGGGRSSVGVPALSGLKPKDLLLLPARLALALQADGWWVRSDCIFAKTNPMPESTRDRPTKSHEYVFLLAKSERYYWDGDACREPHKEPERGRGEIEKNNWSVGGTNDSRGSLVMSRLYNPAGRNMRSVLNIATEPTSLPHFAAYPTKLVKPFLLAGTSERGVCSECGAPWKRVVVREAMVIRRSERTHENGHTRSSGTMLAPARADTVGWQPTCAHDAPTVPATVCDPFCGTATTGVVALRYGRRFIGIELSAEYCGYAEQRLAEAAAQPVMEMAESLPVPAPRQHTLEGMQ